MAKPFCPWNRSSPRPILPWRWWVWRFPGFQACPSFWNRRSLSRHLPPLFSGFSSMAFWLPPSWGFRSNLFSSWRFRTCRNFSSSWLVFTSFVREGFDLNLNGLSPAIRMSPSSSPWARGIFSLWLLRFPTSTPRFPFWLDFSSLTSTSSSSSWSFWWKSPRRHTRGFRRYS